MECIFKYGMCNNLQYFSFHVATKQHVIYIIGIWRVTRIATKRFFRLTLDCKHFVYQKLKNSKKKGNEQRNTNFFVLYALRHNPIPCRLMLQGISVVPGHSIICLKFPINLLHFLSFYKRVIRSQKDQ